MSPLLWFALVVIAVALLFRRQLVGLSVSPLTGGVNYLSDCLKQRGYPHGTVPRATLERLVAAQIELAKFAVGAGSIAIKTDLVRRLPMLADELVDFIEGRPDGGSTWAESFRAAGVPQKAAK